MIDDAPAGEGDWDFLTLVARWNLYGLPALLVLVGLGLVAWRMRRREDSASTLLSVRIIALIHLGLGLRAGIGLAQEMLTLRVQGIPQSFPITGMVIPAVALMVNPVIGHFLWRLRPWARRAAIAWNALVAAITALVAAWQWKFRVAVSPDQWPDYLVSDVLPWLLLVALLLPGVRSLFRQPRVQAADAPAASRLGLVSIVLILLLLVVASTLAVDALDWLVRILDRTGE
jgi:hypothetical protein